MLGFFKKKKEVDHIEALYKANRELKSIVQLLCPHTYAKVIQSAPNIYRLYGGFMLDCPTCGLHQELSTAVYKRWAEKNAR